MIRATPGCSRILIVDDDESTARTFAAMLSMQGHHCDIASTAEDALAMCATSRFDFLLLDVQLKDGSGLAIARALLDTPQRPSQVILVSGHPREEFRQAIQSGVVNDHLLKPCEIDAVIELVCSAKVA
jgi:CheY-like chemotaxis protein